MSRSQFSIDAFFKYQHQGIQLERQIKNNADFGVYRNRFQRYIEEAERKQQSHPLKSTQEKKRKEALRDEQIRKQQRRNGQLLDISASIRPIKEFGLPEIRRESVAPPPPQPPIVSTYRRLRFKCRNTNICTEVSHNHKKDRIIKTENLFDTRENYMQYPDLKDEEFVRQNNLITTILIDPKNYEAQPTYIQDLFQVCISYLREHDVVFQLSCADMVTINDNSEKTSSQLLHDIGALREMDSVFATSRESVRAQFTEARDIIFSELKKAISFALYAIIQEKLLPASSLATVPACMQKIFSDFVAHRDQERLMKEIVLLVESEHLSSTK